MTGYNCGELRTQVANSLPPPDSFDLCRDCCGGGDFHLLRIISSIYVVMVTRARSAAATRGLAQWALMSARPRWGQMTSRTHSCHHCHSIPQNSVVGSKETLGFSEKRRMEKRL